MNRSRFTVRAMLAIPLFVVSCAGPLPPSGDAPAIQFLNSPEMEAQNFPFSEAVRVGEMLYLSGQIGIRSGTRELAPGGIAGETRQVMENIKDVLERNGSSLDRVAKCTVFLADIAEWPAMNEVYRTFFTNSPPARSALGSSGLALGARVEIECLAVMGASATH